MKFIKLLLAFSLILGIFAAVVSCGGSSGTDNETAEESEEEASNEKKKSGSTLRNILRIKSSRYPRAI